MGLFSPPEPEERIVADKALQCVVCGNNRFYSRQALLNTSGASLMGLAWLNDDADCYVCAKCGYIHWFLPPG